MILKTNRLILRPWEISDAYLLYKYASHPEIGPLAGWQPHTSVEYSREIIKTVFSEPETYAIVLEEINELIGSIALHIGKYSNKTTNDSEGEVGYWIGVPFWGQGLATEAVCEIMRYGFDDLNLTKLWCTCLKYNTKSKRVMEKCNFKYSHTLKSEYIACITKNEWREKNIT